RAGYIVGKYISIEKVVEQSKETYYETLLQSSASWHENENDYAPFVRYTLGTILAAYRKFSTRVQLLTTSGLTKPERIREVIRGSLGKITKAEIMAQCPDISQVTVQRTLLELQKKGEILKLSGGRYTAYIWNRENE
ncbi:MAG: cell filamentation protein Fic, partial [Clostridiales bacterium]|nr:cell filamentation protein Fic [Clostridiales bacterium]